MVPFIPGGLQWFRLLEVPEELNIFWRIHIICKLGSVTIRFKEANAVQMRTWDLRAVRSAILLRTSRNSRAFSVSNWCKGARGLKAL